MPDPARPASPEPDDPRTLALRWNVAAVHLVRRLRRADVDLGVPAAQMSALALLVNAGPHTVGDLARYEQVTAQTMTYLVTHLERRGLVARERSDTDRRVVTVAATAAGHDLVDRGRAHRVDWLERRFAALPARDRALLARAVVVMRQVSEGPDEAQP